MLGRNKPEVLVVGAGPVGLFAALALAKSGIRVQIVDKDWRTGAHSYALALHAQSLTLLGELGLLDKILEKAYRVRTVGLYDGRARRAELRLSPREDESGFVAAMRQDALERLLEDALGQQGVPVLWNHEVSRVAEDKDAVAVTVDKMVKESVGYAVAHTEWIVAKSKKIEVPFVVGADGHGSLVRRSLGIDYDRAGPTEHFAVFEFTSNADLNHEMRIVMGGGTTSVLWPLAGGCCRWSFQLADYSAPETSRSKHRIGIQIGPAQFPVLAEDNLRALIEERAPWFEGDVGAIHWRLVVRFERRLAGAFGRRRLWLAGDAGHMTGPAGMQSMNVGLREAAELARILTAILREGESPERLEAYNRQRLAEWRFLLGREGGLAPGKRSDPWIGRHRDRLLACIPASGPELAALARQLCLEVTPREPGSTHPGP